MSSIHKQPIPINECDHVLHHVDETCDIIRVISPDGRPVDVPKISRTSRMLFRHGLEVTLAFVAGFLTAVAAMAR